VAQRKVFRIKAGNNYDIFFETGRPGQGKLTFHFLNTESTELIVRNGKRLLFQSQKEIESRFSLQLWKLKKFKVRNKAVVHIGIETRTAVKNSFLYLGIE
jgi:hypothetical protein